MMFLIIDSKDNKTIQSVSSGKYCNVPEKYIILEIKTHDDEGNVLVEIPEGFYENYSEYNYIDGEFIKVGISLDRFKDNFLKNNDINLTRNNRLSKGFDYNGVHIQCDSGSQGNLTGYILMKDLISYPISWRTYENTIIEIQDESELISISQQMMSYIQSVYSESWSLKDSITAAETESKIESLYEAYINGENV